MGGCHGEGCRLPRGRGGLVADIEADFSRIPRDNPRRLSSPSDTSMTNLNASNLRRTASFGRSQGNWAPSWHSLATGRNAPVFVLEGTPQLATARHRPRGARSLPRDRPSWLFSAHMQHTGRRAGTEIGGWYAVLLSWRKEPNAGSRRRPYRDPYPRAKDQVENVTSGIGRNSWPDRRPSGRNRAGRQLGQSIPALVHRRRAGSGRFAFFSDQHLLQHLLRGNRQPRGWALIRPVRSLRSASHSCSNNGRGIDCGFDRAQYRSLSNAEVSAGAVPSG